MYKILDEQDEVDLVFFNAIVESNVISYKKFDFNSGFIAKRVCEKIIAKKNLYWTMWGNL